MFDENKANKTVQKDAHGWARQGPEGDKQRRLREGKKNRDAGTPHACLLDLYVAYFGVSRLSRENRRKGTTSTLEEWHTARHSDELHGTHEYFRAHRINSRVSEVLEGEGGGELEERRRDIFGLAQGEDLLPEGMGKHKATAAKSVASSNPVVLWGVWFP